MERSFYGDELFLPPGKTEGLHRPPDIESSMSELIMEAWTKHRHGVQINGPVHTTEGDVFYVSFDPKHEVRSTLLYDAVAHAFYLAFGNKVEEVMIQDSWTKLSNDEQHKFLLKTVGMDNLDHGGKAMFALIRRAWTKYNHGIKIDGPVRTTDGDIFYVSFDSMKEVRDASLPNAVIFAYYLAFGKLELE